jgi:hypothetical protein
MWCEQDEQHDRFAVGIIIESYMWGYQYRFFYKTMEEQDVYILHRKFVTEDGACQEQVKLCVSLAEDECDSFISWMCRELQPGT